MKDPDDRGFDAKSLLIEAKRAAEFAYVPYSSFPVGAAILFEDGSVVSGCNVENGSFGLSICAERNAMTTAVREGRIKPVAIAVTGGKEGKICPPCGACRQFLAEFNGDMNVVLEEDGIPVIFRLSDLLPLQFKFSGKGETKDDK
ncbi:MAG: cytidine deaminase [Synergistaceae bacterium]|jgi:cytidine deaminase|nr:cytidine deaminase [Synergistaceae bacterium]MDD2350613.1 cytidine deaminase [Synergistaceae bacterium]MDD3319252.1 cytidine deaminase [Synergistaceae bacterium]MDD3672496.1 cytidine deaminase [Synergistaceae bacterium]MDD5421567.1 cytidine deaminase [Synergistaceae bacterium]